MKTKKTKVTKKVAVKKAGKRGRPKGTTKTKTIVKQSKVKEKNPKLVKTTAKIKTEKPKVKVIKPIPSGVACTGCGGDIPKQRIDACKGTTKCVKCSDVKTKKPIIVNHGTGDNTYQEVVIVDDETYRKHLRVEEATRRALGKPSTMSFDEEEPISKGNDKFITPE
jgi:RNA polymerase-binding transcription factor DksA